MDASGSRANWAAEAGSTSQSHIRNKRSKPPKHHVLVVEDNELVTDALRILFEETGRRVSVAHTVAGAVALARRDPPDLLLLDLKLPDGDGLEVASALAAEGVHPKAIVALTGRDDPASLERCSVAGVTAVMVKPVASRVLLKKTSEWLA